MQKTKKFSRVIIKNELEQYLVVIHPNGQCNFPGGKIEEYENAEQAARRETYEEVGIQVKDLKLVLNNNFPLGENIWDGYFFTCKSYNGNIINNEPEKLLEVGFKDKEWVIKNGPKMFVADIIDFLDKSTQKTTKLRV